MTHAPDSGDSRALGPDRISELVRLAGRRPAPDPQHVSRARAAARAEWTRVVGRRTWRSLWGLAGAAVAAAVLVVTALSVLRPGSVPAPRVEIAALQTVVGSVLIAGDGERPRSASSGTQVLAGDRVEAGLDGRVSLVMPGGVSVRFDRATMAVLASRGRLILERGAIYVDARPGSSDAVLRIETPFGLVRHTGTQFEVRLEEAGAVLRVRVREGSVAVETTRGRWTSRAGEALVFVPGRPVERSAIATSGPEWSWVSGLAEPFSLEGAAATAFLAWVSREQGWHLEFADPSLQARVERIVLHGTIEGMTPEEALAAVLPTCGLTSRVVSPEPPGGGGGRLIVSAVRR